MNTILKLDIAGNPLRWIGWQEAASLYVQDAVAWDFGDDILTVHGGRSRLDGLQSIVEVRPIVAVHGSVVESHYQREVPPLTNRALFRRDQHTCLYCGEQYADDALTRDHVIPQCQHGPDEWSNVVAACGPCNNVKGGRTPKEAGMKLLAVPYVPNYAEWLILSNRRIVADQMEFLKERVGRASRVTA